MRGVVAFALCSGDRAVEDVTGLGSRVVAGAVEGAVVDSGTELCGSVSRALRAQPGPFVSKGISIFVSAEADVRGKPTDAKSSGGSGLSMLVPNGLDKCFVRACVCAVLNEEGCQFAVSEYVECVSVVRVGEEHVCSHAYYV